MSLSRYAPPREIDRPAGPPPFGNRALPFVFTICALLVAVPLGVKGMTAGIIAAAFIAMCILLFVLGLEMLGSVHRGRRDVLRADDGHGPARRQLRDHRGRRGRRRVHAPVPQRHQEASLGALAVRDRVAHLLHRRLHLVVPGAGAVVVARPHDARHRGHDPSAAGLRLVGTPRQAAVLARRRLPARADLQRHVRRSSKGRFDRQRPLPRPHRAAHGVRLRVPAGHLRAAVHRRPPAAGPAMDRPSRRSDPRVRHLDQRQPRVPARAAGPRR